MGGGGEARIGFPWNSCSIIENIYKMDNYCIKDTKARTGRALIFFSGNGLYYPNSEETFVKTICDKNRYEWENTAKSKVLQNYFERMIFVRDVYKQWYVKGINDRADSVDAVVKLLEEITKGYEVTTCGNSAGGYMAVLAGIQMGANKIFSFSGQFSIENQLKRPIWEAPYLHKYKFDEQRNCYFSLVPYLIKENNVFYFYPGKCQYDIEQHNLIRDCPIYKYKLDCDSHGDTVCKECYPYILVSSAKKLRQLEEYYRNCWIDKQYFCRDLLPWHLGIIYNIRCFAKYLKNKLSS